MERGKLNPTFVPSQVLRRFILRNLHYWHEYVKHKNGNAVALDHSRKQIIDVALLALELNTAWSTVRDLIESYTSYIERYGAWDDWHHILQRAIEKAQRVGDVQGEATLSVLFARLLRRQNQFQPSTRYYRRAIRSARQIGNTFNEARACTNLGYYYIEHGYWHRAEVFCCAALRQFEAIESEYGRAHTHNHLGLLYTRQGRWEQACDLWQDQEDAYGLINGYVNLGVLYHEKRSLDQSIHFSEKALQQAETVGERTMISTIYLNIGNAYRLKGDLALAENYYLHVQRCLQQFPDQIVQALLFDNLGLLALDQEEWLKAIPIWKML